MPRIPPSSTERNADRPLRRVTHAAGQSDAPYGLDAQAADDDLARTAALAGRSTVPAVIWLVTFGVSSAMIAAVFRPA